jgi:hypothetical protein
MLNFWLPQICWLIDSLIYVTADGCLVHASIKLILPPSKYFPFIRFPLIYTVSTILNCHFSTNFTKFSHPLTTKKKDRKWFISLGTAYKCSTYAKHIIVLSLIKRQWKPTLYKYRKMILFISANFYSEEFYLLAVHWKSTDISEELVVTAFRVEG